MARQRVKLKFQFNLNSPVWSVATTLQSTVLEPLPNEPQFFLTSLRPHCCCLNGGFLKSNVQSIWLARLTLTELPPPLLSNLAISCTKSTGDSEAVPGVDRHRKLLPVLC